MLGYSTFGQSRLFKRVSCETFRMYLHFNDTGGNIPPILVDLMCCMYHHMLKIVMVVIGEKTK